MLLMSEDQSLLHDTNLLWEKTNSQKQKNEKVEGLMNKKRNRELNKVSSAEGNAEKSRESDHEMHIWTERERRKKMKNMFASLHALLPHLPSKADKSTVVDEAVSYIKNLERTLEKLEKQKEERVRCGPTFWNESSPSMFTAQGLSSNYGFSNAIMGTSSNALLFPAQQQPVAFDKTWASSNMVLNVCGDEAQFCICAAHKPGLVSTIVFVLDKYKIELVYAHISCLGNGNAIMIQAHGKRASHQFLDANSVEEIYRQAAGEILLWIA
ncbi:Transcription factor bHLH19 Basic helix-loop-helix protein [Vigna angularis]|uniref:Transcription factor bHLH19 Basic helix-loop-helix protein n=1 Tax=Phaseolus angularis TaxID=3914 RepID=A0A8T0LC77_PHAAN|nr:transcription factor bHLH95 [Vigna angularis]KAG2409192.1 Transcription factor bHLH19 Basic helix-loop-helix protein [Vigna angularis]